MSKYYCAITKNDWIKYANKLIPFWLFLDENPDGYLCSLAYRTKKIPDWSMFWDCGAWSYKSMDIPKLGKYLVTPEWAFNQYETHAMEGDIIIAPDHMLIPGMGNLNIRREFNIQSAQKFIKIATSKYKPMAVVHGLTLEERITTAQTYVDMGYTHLALGGLAGRASQKKFIMEIVTAIRQKFSNIWIHVLGLSSPLYAAEWYTLNINSFDGSSHFKQAFMCGLYFVANGEKLDKYKASRQGEKVTAPLCYCRACAMLRKENVDTRTYGSNATNMGRAAHNLNQLLLAHKTIKDRICKN